MLRKITLIILLTVLGFNTTAQMDKGSQREKEVKERIWNLVKSGKITQEEADKVFYQEMQKYLNEQNVPIEFYGMVIDQEGNPVKDADVFYSVDYYTLDPANYKDFNYGKVKTDQNGIFSIRAKSGISVGVTRIEGEGYEDSFKATNKYAEYTTEGYIFEHRTEIPGKPDPSNPEIFKLRKRGEPTMLITSSTDKISFVKGEHKSYAVCLVPRASYYHKDILEKAMEAKKRIDLIIEGDYKEGLFKIMVKPLGDKSAGVLLGDAKLYIAPESGYKNEEEIVVQKGADRIQQLWLYARTGSPIVYSRVDLKVIQQEKTVIVEYSSYLNPYGERGLEGATNIGWLGQKCTDIEREANKALKEGKYPPKPDFKALEEEGKKEYLKTHKDAQ